MAKALKTAADPESPWKEVFDDLLPIAMAFMCVQFHAEVDWSRGFISREQELLNIIGRRKRGRLHVDKLYQVWLKNGEEHWILIHIEIQNQRDPDFPKRMFNYRFTLIAKYNREIFSLAVLADDQPDWRPSRYVHEFFGSKLYFEFPVVKILDYAQEIAALDANPNPFALVILAHLRMLETKRDPQRRLDSKVWLIRRLRERGHSKEDVRKLLKFIDWILILPEPLEAECMNQISQDEEGKSVPYVTSFERHGIKKGLTRGRKEGRQEGLLEAIEIGLQLGHGERGLKLLPEFRKLTNLRILKRACESLMAGSSLEEIKELLT